VESETFILIDFLRVVTLPWKGRGVTCTTLLYIYQQSNNCDVQNQWQQEQKSALLDDAAIFW